MIFIKIRIKKNPREILKFDDFSKKRGLQNIEEWGMLKRFEKIEKRKGKSGKAVFGLNSYFYLKFLRILKIGF